jgi:hypothetical protein
VNALQRMVGRHILVPASLVADQLTVQASTTPAGVDLHIKSSIMESVKVFDAVDVVLRGSTLYLRVYSSLAFWDRNGSPDFAVTEHLDLPGSTIEVVYGTPEESTPLCRIDVGSAE